MSQWRAVRAVRRRACVVGRNQRGAQRSGALRPCEAGHVLAPGALDAPARPVRADPDQDGVGVGRGPAVDLGLEASPAPRRRPSGRNRSSRPPAASGLDDPCPTARRCRTGSRSPRPCRRVYRHVWLVGVLARGGHRLYRAEGPARRPPGGFDAQIGAIATVSRPRPRCRRCRHRCRAATRSRPTADSVCTGSKLPAWSRSRYWMRVFEPSHRVQTWCSLPLPSTTTCGSNASWPASEMLIGDR